MSQAVATKMVSYQDRVTGSPKGIDTDHSYIHEGIAFENSLTITASATTDRIAFLTPAVKYVHFRPSQVFLSKGSVDYSLWENATSTAMGGTTSTGSYNRNRNSATTATMSIHTAATSTGGVIIDRWTMWGSGTTAGSGRQGAAYSEPLEWVLKRGTEYRVQLSSTEAMTVNMFWYEEDDG